MEKHERRIACIQGFARFVLGLLRLMEEMKHQKFLTVAPFKCAWLEELEFREAGRGCVAFEAFACNDVTIVFREELGSEHYHYRMDNGPNYTIVIGSHSNRRLKIEVNGKAVVDVAGGLDEEPNCNVQYVELSSWDKHVGYRNVSVLPLSKQCNWIWKHLDYKEYESGEEEEEENKNVTGDPHAIGGLGHFFENWDLSDVSFLVGEEEKAVPGHKIILAASGNFDFGSPPQNEIKLPSATYQLLGALLEYIYTGRTQVEEHQLCALKDLALYFEVLPLMKLCEEIIDHFKTNKKLFDPDKYVELVYANPRPHRCFVFPCEYLVDIVKLKKMFLKKEHSDVNVYIDGCGLAAQTHRLILRLWSPPLMKMFTNGMIETNMVDIQLRDISSEAFLAMLQFMYGVELEARYGDGTDLVLLELLLLADQFDVTSFHRECCSIIYEHLAEDMLCPILQAISSIPSCKPLKEVCERKFSLKFDYFTTSSSDFVFLDESTFTNILQHPDLTVTSEERVLDAILL